jgi:hypothetical protein
MYVRFAPAPLWFPHAAEVWVKYFSKKCLKMDFCEINIYLPLNMYPQRAFARQSSV